MNSERLFYHQPLGRAGTAQRAEAGGQIPQVEHGLRAGQGELSTHNSAQGIGQDQKSGGGVSRQPQRRRAVSRVGKQRCYCAGAHRRNCCERRAAEKSQEGKVPTAWVTLHDGIKVRRKTIEIPSHAYIRSAVREGNLPYHRIYICRRILSRRCVLETHVLSLHDYIHLHLSDSARVPGLGPAANFNQGT